MGFFFRSGSGSGYYVLAWLSFYFTFYFLLDTILVIVTILPVCVVVSTTFLPFFLLSRYMYTLRLLNRYVLLDAVTGIAADIASVPVWFFYLFYVQMDLTTTNRGSHRCNTVLFLFISDDLFATFIVIRDVYVTSVCQCHICHMSDYLAVKGKKINLIICRNGTNVNTGIVLQIWLLWMGIVVSDLKYNNLSLFTT